MTRGAILLCYMIVALAVPSADIYADTLDCVGGTVFVGDSRVDLLSKCGEPDAKESHDEELTERLDHDTKQRLFITVEQWTYNYGPSQFMRIVILKNGVIAGIRTGNYGYSKQTKQTRQECSEQIVAIGDVKTDVLAKCGEPTWKDVHQEEFKERLESGLTRSVFVNVEEWTYNLGTNRFVRNLTFRNGKLTDIKTGGYGYEMKTEEKRKTP